MNKKHKVTTMNKLTTFFCPHCVIRMRVYHSEKQEFPSPPSCPLCKMELDNVSLTRGEHPERDFTLKGSGENAEFIEVVKTGRTIGKTVDKLS